MHRLAQDVRLALRGFRRAPAFAAAVIAILALGIGMASAMTAITDAVLRRPLPVQTPASLATVWPTRAGVEFSLIAEDLDELRRTSRTTRGIAGFIHWGAFPFAITDGDRPLVLPQARVTGNFFTVLGVRPALGRLLRPEDDVDGAPPVIVLSDGTWRRDFGGDPAVLGRRLRLPSFGIDVTVVGVAPPGLDYPLGTAYWAPFATTGHNIVVDLVVRLAPGATPAMAGVEVLALMQRRHADLAPDGAETHSLTEAIVGRVRPALVVLTAAVALLLLIACVNVGSLLLVRAAGRARELAVRRAIGASVGDIVHQLVVESALLGIAGGIAGAVAATGLVRLLLAVAADRLPRADLVGRSGVPTAVCVAITLFTVLACGVLPALVTARGAPASPLRLDARSGRESRARRRTRGWLVASQVALAIVMLAGAGLLSRSLARLERLDLGYRPEGLSLAQITFTPRADVPFGPSFLTYYAPRFEQAFQRIRAIPGVVGVSPVLIPPFLGPNVWTWKPELWGQSPADAESTPMIPVEAGGAEYFRTMGIPIIRGRGFVEGDREDAPHVAIVSESAARRLWPNANPIGQRLRYEHLDSTGWRTVVGVTGDLRYRSLRETTPTIFLPWRQSVNQGAFAIRTTGDPAPIFDAIRRAVREVDPDFALWHPQTMSAYLAGPMAQPRTNALLLAGFALVALVLAAVGLYGVLASTVGERTRELGVRAALGATPARLRRDVLLQAVALCSAGSLVGLTGAVATSRLLAALLFEVSPVDPATLGGVCVLLFAVALIAAWLPARRATRIDPARALRAD